MLRYLLLLVLSAPLFYVGYEQAVALFGLDKPLGLREAALSGPRAALGEPGKRDAPQPGVQAALLSVSDDCPPPRADSEADRMVGPAFKEHADHLKDVRRLFIALADPTSPEKDKVVRSTFKGWLAKRAEVFGLQDEIEKLYKAYLKSPTDRGDLDLKLDTYKKERWRSDSFVTKVEGGMSRREMTDLAEASRVLSIALRAKADAPSRTEVLAKADKIIQEREQFLDKFPTFPEATAVRDELAHWKKARGLLDVSAMENERASPSEAKRLLGDYAALLKGSPPTFRALVRTTAQRYCNGYVKPVALDEKVVLSGAEVLREQVKVFWSSTNKSVWLKDSGFDEFTLPTSKKYADVENFTVDGTTHEKPIRPTERSKAARAFNEKLKAIRWTKEGLADLLRACDSTSYKAYLTEPRDRVEAVHQALIEHPELFSGRD